MTSGLLAELMAGALEDAAERSADLPTGRLERLALDAAPPLDALDALAPRDEVHVIAEIKRASPSRGALATIADPAELARAYAAGGASAISVLTESRRFGGSLADLRAVRAAVDVPLLRKDFVGNEYQVLEARAAGADLVLLIVAALAQPVLDRLHRFVAELGMTPLVEAHDADELERALALPVPLIGVNNRDLRTFEVSLDTSLALRPRVDDGRVFVTESGIATRADVARLRAAGIDAFLVGESFMRAADPGVALAELFAGT